MLNSSFNNPSNINSKQINRSFNRYYQIFVKNFDLGFKTGVTIHFSSPVSTILPISKFPMTNRLIEVGLFNILQHYYYLPIANTNFTMGVIENFIYKGDLQIIKYFPNLWVQNTVKKKLSELNLTKLVLLDNSLNLLVFVPIFLGMTIFNIVGAIESAVPTARYKFYYTSLCFSAVSILAIKYCYSSSDSIIQAKNYGALYLTPENTALAGLGLIFSFFAQDFIARQFDENLSINVFYFVAGVIIYNALITANYYMLGYGAFIAVNSFLLKEQAFMQNYVVDLQDIANFALLLYAPNLNDCLKILAVASAKAVAVTGVTLLVDNIDILDYFFPIIKEIYYTIDHILPKEDAIHNLKDLSLEFICKFPLIHQACKFFHVREDLTSSDYINDIFVGITSINLGDVY
jgi:hypothetical protein